MNKKKEVLIMAFSLDSKVKDILKNPAAAAVLDKYSPDASKNPQMKLVGGLTLRKLACSPIWRSWTRSFRRSSNYRSQKRSLTTGSFLYAA